MKSILKWMPALLLVSLFSCAGEKDIFDAQPYEKPGVYGYLTPFVEEGAETRATVEPDNDWKYVWEVGDKINIWSEEGTLLVYTVKNVSSSGRAEFAGGGFTLTEGETYYSSHPLVRSTLEDYKSLPTWYDGQVQTANNDGRHLAEYTYTYTSAPCTNGNTSFQYHHLTCYLRFVITLPKAMTLTELTITADGNLFALDGKADVTTGVFTPNRVSDSMTLTLDNIEVGENELLKAFMCVAPCSAGKYVIRVTDSENKVYTSPEISKPDMTVGWAYRFETEVFEGEDPVVCKIGDVTYTTLEDAVAAVPADGKATTITMLADHDIAGNAGVTIPVGKNVVLDLNGKTVTLVVAESKGSQLITNRGTLTITDSSTGQSGKLTNMASDDLAVGSWPTNNYVTNIITNSGVLNIEAGTLQSTANGSICYAVDNNSTSYDAVLNVNGGYLTSVGTVIRQFCNSTTKQNVVNVSGGTVETNGSAAMWTQLPGNNASSKKLATLNITGGVVRGGTYAWYDYSYGDSFEAVNYSISGGEIYGYLYSYAVAQGVKPGFVTGGLFSENDSSLCAPGLMFVASADHPGMFEIGEAEVYYAWEDDGTMVGENCYFAAPFVNGWLMDGEFITLLKNVTLTADIACQLESGTFSLTLGDYSVTKGDYSVSLKTGVSVKTDKQTDIFTAAETGYTVVETALADGYKYTVTPLVAKIGDVEYETLEAAFAAAEGGQTITLLADCAGNGIIAPKDKFGTAGLTIDFNGHTYDFSGDGVGSSGTENNGFQLLDGNTITFKNGTLTASSDDAGFLIQNYSNLTLENMTVDGSDVWGGYTLSNNNGNVVIDGSTIIAPAGGFAFDVCRYASYPSVNVTVKGESAINGNVEVSASGSDPKNGFSLTLTSGTMSGDLVIDGSAKTAMANNPTKAVITKSDSFVKDAPAGFKWVGNGDGTSTLKEVVPVAQVGGVEYETLEAAFAAAEDGQTIMLVADCSGNGIVAPKGKFTTSGLTLDFNGHIYEVDGNLVGSNGTETQGMQFLMDNKITLKNGTFTSSKALFLIQNYSDLTLKNMTLSLTNANYAEAYTLSNNNGTVVIDGTTINANTGGGFAFDVCRYSSYPSVNVTVTGSSFINGDVEVSASGSDPKDGFSLTLTSATMGGNIVLDGSAKTAMANNPDKAVVKKNDAVSVSAPAGYGWVSNGDGTSTLLAN